MGTFGHKHRLVAIMIAGAAVQLAAPFDAYASFTNAQSQGFSVTTAQLLAPTSVSAVKGTCHTLSSTAVNLSWTATTSTAATGYDILRSTTSGSGYTLIASVTPSSTVSYIDTTVAFSTRYYYVLQSSRNSWRSANSNEDPVTTQGSTCLGGNNN